MIPAALILAPIAIVTAIATLAATGIATAARWRRVDRDASARLARHRGDG